MSGLAAVFKGDSNGMRILSILVDEQQGPLAVRAPHGIARDQIIPGGVFDSDIDGIEMMSAAAMRHPLVIDHSSGMVERGIRDDLCIVVPDGVAPDRPALAAMMHDAGLDRRVNVERAALGEETAHIVREPQGRKQSIVPGSGVGGGGRYSRDLNEKNGAQDQLQTSSVITIREFWYAELKFSSQRAINADWNKSGESLGINLYARNRSLPVMTFYGLGPNTNVNNSVKFSQRDTSAGIEVTTPFPELPWLSAGGRIEGLWPSVGGVTGSNIVSIQQEYTEQTAPGLASQPPFVHEETFFLPHKRFLVRWELNGNVGYNFYQDTNTGHYPFRRFEANLEQRFYPEKKKHGGVIEQNYFAVRWRYSVSNTTARGGYIEFA